MSMVNWHEVGESAASYCAGGTSCGIGYATGEWILLIGGIGLMLVRASVDIPRAYDYWQKRKAKAKRKRK